MKHSKNLEFSETNPQLLSDFPGTHLEKLDTALLEKMTLQEAGEYVGENCYFNFVEKSPGILGAFEELTDGGGKNVFAKYYGEYMNHSQQLKERMPKIYAFMREWIFFGREYEVSPVKASELSFTGGLGTSNIEHIRGKEKISEAERKDMDAYSLESKAHKC